MMNDIKFRAWDKKDRVIRDVVGMSFYHDSVSVDIEYGRYLQDDSSRFEIMQYTGLKDVKGVDIYENDIVIFDDSERSYHGIVKAGGWYLYLDLYEAYDVVNFDEFSDENDMTADVQVIGNVYENSELLEDEVNE